MITAEFIPSRVAAMLSSALTKIVKLYAQGGFVVRLVLMDREFECIEDDFDKVVVNTSAAREHVGEIERQIRVVKERCRCTNSELREAGYQYYHRMVIIHLVYFVCMFVNGYIHENGISQQYSPREIVLGRAIDFEKDCKATFGAYVEASRDDTVTNTTRDRTHPCIALGPSGNLQGSTKCFDLLTGKVVVRRTVKELPWPDRLLKLVNKWREKFAQRAVRGQASFP